MISFRCAFILASLLPFFSIKGQSVQSFDQAAAVHIDHIEEFIDRFNFYEDSQFARYVEAEFQDQSIDRDFVLKSLFNKNSGIPDARVSEFIAAVTNQVSPTFLDVYDALWYAKVPVEIHCDEDETISLDITLEVQLNADYSIEWAIAGMKSQAFSPKESETEFYISSSSHATYFPELLTGLSRSDVFQDIVTDRNVQGFVYDYEDLMKEKRINKVDVLAEITFHFLQIPNWIVVVKYKPQDYSFNTGWLIDRLIPVESFKEKRIYLIEELNVKVPG